MKRSLDAGKVRVCADDAIAFAVLRLDQPLKDNSSVVEANLSFHLARRFVVRSCYQL
jgi:hypothetical protein